MTNSPTYNYEYMIYVQVYDDKMACQTAVFAINTNDYIIAVNVASALYRQKYQLSDDTLTVEIILGVEKVKNEI